MNFRDEIETKTKIKPRDENEIKISDILVRTKSSDAKFGSTYTSRPNASFRLTDRAY